MAKIARKLLPDPVHGKKVYAEQCAACHGANGDGIRGADGVVGFPPLWGERWFNIRAGMAAGELTLTDTAGKSYPIVCSLTERQQAILLAGGLLNYTKEHAL